MRTATQTKQPALPAQPTQHNCPGCIRDGLAKRRKRAHTRYCPPHMGQLYLDCEETGVRLHHPSHYVIPLIALGTDTRAPDGKPIWYALHDAAKIVSRMTKRPVQSWRHCWVDAHDQQDPQREKSVRFCAVPDDAIPALERALALGSYSPVYKPFPDPADPAEIGPIDEEGLDEMGIDADLTRESVAGFRALLARITTPVPVYAIPAETIDATTETPDAQWTHSDLPAVVEMLGELVTTLGAPSAPQAPQEEQAIA